MTNIIYIYIFFFNIPDKLYIIQITPISYSYY